MLELLVLLTIVYVVYRMVQRKREQLDVKRHDPSDVGYVYVYRDAEGRVLYVGQTERHPLRRGVEHVRYASWMLAAKRLDWHAVKLDRLDAQERQAIRTLKPLHNKMRYR